MNSNISDGRDELWEQLSRAIELRSSQDQVLWTIFGLFGATNAILLVALLDGGKFPENPWAGAVVTGAGASLSLVWDLIQRRALGHIKRYEDLMARLERQLHVPPNLAVSATINTAAFERHLNGGIPARTIMTSCGKVSATLWAIAFFVFLSKGVCLL